MATPTAHLAIDDRRCKPVCMYKRRITHTSIQQVRIRRRGCGNRTRLLVEHKGTKQTEGANHSGRRGLFRG